MIDPTEWMHGRADGATRRLASRCVWPLMFVWTLGCFGLGLWLLIGAAK